MLRITLEKPFEPMVLKLGYEVAVPMQFGSYTPEVTTEFRGAREALPAQPRIWELDFADPEKRSVLVPNEVAVHYFGDWRAGSDPQAVKDKRIPSLNAERERVAKVWGDYHYSNRHGHYATIKIDVPKMPHVVVQAVNANGTIVGDWAYRPWEFLDFSGQLDANAATEMAEVLAKRGSQATMTFDLANMPPAMREALAGEVDRMVQAALAKKATAGK